MTSTSQADNGKDNAVDHQTTRAFVTTWEQTGDPTLRLWLDSMRGVHRRQEESAEAIPVSE